MDTTEREEHGSRVAASADVWRELVVLGGLCAFLFFYGLGRFGLVGADEPRYAQIAREMLQRSDWVVPVLNGKPWLEKPVLFYWQAMVSYSVFGVSDWAARIPNAVNATAMVLAIYVFARRFNRGVQLDAGLIAASAAAVIGFARAASTDMPLTATFTIAMLAWLDWHITGRKRWLLVFYAFLGLGMLAKGPVAPFLAALIIVALAAIRRNLRIAWRTVWLPGIFAFLAISLPWYIAVQSRVPEFFRTFIVEHNLARYGSNLYRHHQPFWYYVPVILMALLPWTVLAIAGLVSAVRDFRQGGQGRAPGENSATDVPVFAALWASLPVVFFSFSGSKLPGYILPAVPGFVLLAVNWLSRKAKGDASPNMLIASLHLLVANLVLATALLSNYIVFRIRPTAQAYLVAGGVTGFVLLVSLALVFLRGLRVLRLVTLVPVIIGMGFVLKITAPAIDAAQSARPVASEVRAELSGGTPLAAFHIRRELEYGLSFYLNRPMSVYERAEIPSGDHLVVMRTGAEGEMAALVPGRRITRLRQFAPQGIDICTVEAAR